MHETFDRGGIHMLHIVQDNLAWVLLAVSEVLALSPLKSNSIVMLIINAIKAMAGAEKPKA